MKGVPAKKEERLRLVLTFGLGLALCCALYAAAGMWPFGPNSVITGDLNGQYINYFAQFRRAMLSEGSMAYSFTKSLGGSMLGIFAYYAASLFNVLYLIFPPSAYAQVAGVVLALKLACAGVAFAFYAGRHWGLRGWSMPMGLCYGFMAYNLVFAQNIMWHDVVILLPLICYGIDALVRTGRPFVFLGWLALAIYSNFYIAYMACIFAVLYFGVQMLLAGAPIRADAGGTGRFWGARCAAFAAGALCAGLLCGVFLLPWLANISASKGIGGGFQFTWDTLFPLRELAQQMWPGNFIWENVQAGLPNVYCGVFAAVLALCFFVCRRVALQEKLLWGGLLAVLTAGFLFSGLNLLWHGMAEPVWFPYRNAFLFSFVVLALACGTLARGDFSRRGAVLGLCLFGVLGLWTFLVRYVQLTLTKLALAGIFVLAGLVLLWASRRVPGQRPRLRRACAALCALLAVCEVAVNGAAVLDSFEKYTVAGYREYLEQGAKTVAAIQAADTGDYRMEKTFFRTHNDPMLLDFHGLSHFGSTKDNNVTDLLVLLGLDGTLPLAKGALPSADGLLGVKYLFCRPEDVHAAHYTPTGIEAPYAVYENPYALPLAFLADGAAAGYSPEKDAPLYEVQNGVYGALLGRATPLYTGVALSARDARGEKAPLLGPAEAGVTYTFTATETGPYYFSLSISEAWRVVLAVNGAPGPSFSGVDFNGAVYLGDFEKGDTVSVTADMPATKVTAVSAAWLNVPLLEECVEGLRAGAQALDWKDGLVTGSVRAQEPGLLFTSVPYEENWALTVNGKRTEPRPLLGGMLTGVPLEAGTNEVRLQYRVPHLGAGVLLSALGAAGTAALYLFSRRRRRKAAAA